jgi:hypothetical protein
MGRMRQEDGELEANMSNIVRPCVKKKKRKEIYEKPHAKKITTTYLQIFFLM